MAYCYEDFDSDIDEELLSEFTPVLSNFNRKCDTEVTQNIPDNAPAEVKKERDWSLLTISSDGKLSDCERKELFAAVEAQWHAYSTRNGEVLPYIHRVFNASEDPYLSAVYMMATSYDFLKSKPHSLAIYVIDQFENWLEEQKRFSGNYPPLPQGTVFEAIHAVSKQKNAKLVEKIVRIYRAIDVKEKFVELIQYLVETKAYFMACRMALALKIFNAFSVEDFIIPLILQDKLPMVQDYLQGNTELQKKTIEFLDHYVNSTHLLRDYSLDHRIPEVRQSRLTSKNLGKLITSLIRRFNLSMDLCPQTSTRHSTGGLRYLFHKKYDEEKETTENANWEEMVHLAVGESAELQAELINLFCKYGDVDAAVMWAVRYAVPPDRLPFDIAQLVESSKLEKDRLPELGAPSTTSADVSTSYYNLNISLDRVHWIATIEDLQECMKKISRVSLVGFDVEWRASFSGQPVRAALIQIATRENVFIVDLFALREVEKINAHQSQILISSLFANPSLLKLGFSLKEDIQAVSRALPGLEQLPKQVVKVADLHSLWTSIQNQHPTFFDSSAGTEDTSKGLSELVRQCWGFPLDKREQCSDWERRPLRQTQMIYAALDAYCLVEIYDFLKQRAETLGIAFCDIGTRNAEKTKAPKVPRGRAKQLPYAQERQEPQAPYFDSPMSPSDVRFVCDSMVHRLGKLLRSCGIDAVLLSDEACVHAALNEDRLILSRGSVAQKLSQHVAAGRCLSIVSDQPETQILQVIQFYNIHVEEKHIFTRCQICNSNTFHVMKRQQLLRFRPEVASQVEDPQDAALELGIERAWSVIEWPSEMEKLGRTSTGAAIQTAAIPAGVIAKQSAFYICTDCGKCYWMGSHWNKILGQGSLRYVLSPRRLAS